jgi:omega-amidase
MYLNIAMAFDYQTTTEQSFINILPKVDFLVLPEMFFGGYNVMRKDRNFVVKENHEVITHLKNLSKQYNVCVIAGSMPMGTSAKDRKNVSLVFHKGKQIYRYEKMHLFKPLNENKLFKPGEEISNFKVSIRGKSLNCSTIICYDLRFPELTRMKAFKGLDILFVPAWWPKERDEVWSTLLRARAIENQMFTIGINSSDRPCGNSYAYGPGGKLVHATRENTLSFYNFSINLDDIKETKKLLDSLADAKLRSLFKGC